ncbi:MAG: trigger factor [Anaerolineales bacterium]|nr:trigger factor [Anaerolineales bacterium]
MNVETETLENRQVEMRVEVPQDRLQNALQTAARRLSKDMKIPGFRPGKAPYNVVASKVGEDYLLDEALDDLGQQVYREALEEAELEPYAPGTLEEIVSRDPLVLRYRVPLKPEVNLGDYRSLRVDFEEPEVEDDAVEEVLEDLRQNQAVIEPVERSAKMGDLVVVDVTGELVGDDEGGQLLDEKNASLILEEETDWPVPDIAEELVGFEAGQETDVEHTFPDDYRNESLQGKTATFHFTVLEVKSRIVPEWTDDLARNLGDFDDLLALRMQVRGNLKQELEQRTKSEYAEEVMEKISDDAAIQYPPVLLEREIDDMVHDLQHRLERRNMDLEEYLQIEGKSMEELREELEPDARERLVQGLILGKVVEEEDIEISDEQIDEALNRLVSAFEGDREEILRNLNNPATRRSVEVDLLTDQAMERLVQIAQGKGDEPDDEEQTIRIESGEGGEVEILTPSTPQSPEDSEE